MLRDELIISLTISNKDCLTKEKQALDEIVSDLWLIAGWQINAYCI